MTQMEINEIVDKCVEGAKANLLKDGHLVPALIIVNADAPLVMALSMANEAEKEMLAKAMPKILKQFNAEAAIIITDGWLKDPTNTFRIGESIGIFGASPRGKFAKAVNYTRDKDGNPVFAETITGDSAEIRFFKYVTWGCPDLPFAPYDGAQYRASH